MSDSEKSINNEQLQPQSQVFAQAKEAKQIGNFTLGRTMGKGTFGKVKQGTHVQTQEKVAIKILEKSKINDQSDLERINREIAILKKVRHPNIVQLYDLIENYDYLYLIMEYCSGDELFKYIVQKRRLDENESCRMFQQLVSGIEYIHQIGVVHRDLKPENILLDHNNNLKLVDFGLSNLYKEGETLKTACGSPCYAAPEMIKGERYFGLNADIWSSGVVLYAMVCGYLPFEDQVTKKLYQKIMNAEYKLPQFLSEQCKDLISKILNTNPLKRYTIQDIRNHPWYNLVPPQEKTGFIIGKDVLQIDEKILDILETKHQFEKDRTISDLKRNKFNNATTTYYLIQKKNERAGLLKLKYSKEVQKLHHKKVQPSQGTDRSNPLQNNDEQEEEDNSLIPQQQDQKRRKDNSLDVRQYQQPVILRPNANLNSTLNPDMNTNQTPFMNQRTVQLDPFAKLNPKARLYVDTIERQRTEAKRKIGSGGSISKVLEITHQSQQINDRNQVNQQPQNPIINSTTLKVPQNSLLQTSFDSTITNSQTQQQSSIPQHQRANSMPPKPTIPQQQTQQNQTMYISIPNSGRPTQQYQMQVPSNQLYHSYLLSENTSPHYRSPLNNPVTTQNNQYFSAAIANQMIYQQQQPPKVQLQQLKSQIQSQQQEYGNGYNRVSTTIGTSSKKYRSASRSNDQGNTPKGYKNIHPVKCKTIKTGNMTSLSVVRSKRAQDQQTSAQVNLSFQNEKFKNNTIDPDTYTPKAQQIANQMQYTQQISIKPRNAGMQQQPMTNAIYNTTRTQFPQGTNDYSFIHPIATQQIPPMQSTQFKPSPNTGMPLYLKSISPNQTIYNGNIIPQNMTGNAYMRTIGYQNAIQQQPSTIQQIQGLNLSANEMVAFYNNALNAQQILNAKRVASGIASVNSSIQYSNKVGNSLNTSLF